MWKEHSFTAVRTFFGIAMMRNSVCVDGVYRVIVHFWMVEKTFCFFSVRKHLTGGFLCAGLDLSGILCSLLIPQYSGIKRRGKPLPGSWGIQAFPSIRLFGLQDSILKSRDFTLPTKVRLVKAMVFPVVMYGCESWTVKKAERRRIDAFELKCWRRLLRVPWTARRSN